ncbi:hypothetical protein A7K99_15725 [Tatumella citrea]|uniref:Uncharacterized protein n=1 Tax=Tatumella citrea TaxID=53336 RepID=A0A1Y0LBU0_TATCI|nr:hypothetical protein A7K98_15740 [Tatumella citrea]ARU99106.1 hypothetical protein A7K99_15725 [Tatumella citrea]
MPVCIRGLLSVISGTQIQKCKKTIRQDGLSVLPDVWQLTAHSVNRPSGRCRSQRSKALLLSCSRPGRPHTATGAAAFHCACLLSDEQFLEVQMQKGHPSGWPFCLIGCLAVDGSLREPPSGPLPQAAFRSSASVLLPPGETPHCHRRCGVSLCLFVV